MSEEPVVLAWPKPSVDPSSRLDLREARRRLGMNQSQFAAAFGLSLGDLRRWEKGAAIVDPTARTLLTLIARDPECVQRALERGSLTGPVRRS